MYLWLVKQPFICHNYVSNLLFLPVKYTFSTYKIGSVDFDGTQDIQTSLLVWTNPIPTTNRGSFIADLDLSIPNTATMVLIEFSYSVSLPTLRYTSYLPIEVDPTDVFHRLTAFYGARLISRVVNPITSRVSLSFGTGEFTDPPSSIVQAGNYCIPQRIFVF